MASTSQPIALRPSNPPDYPMQDAAGSYSGSSSRPFNPASYTRQFIGSPISWRGGSFGMSGIASSGSLSSSWGSRIPVGSPTHRLLSSWEAGKMSPSSIDGDRGSILNALSVFDREGEFCRNYTCCGLHQKDMHALLEHFEEVHVVVLDRNAPNPQAHIQIPFNPQVNEITPQQQQQQQQRQQHQQMFAHQTPLTQPTPFDPDDMELELDLDSSPHPAPPPSAAHSASSHSSPSSGAPSPPDTPISTPLSAYPSPHAFVPSHLPNGHFSPYISQPSSPLSGTAASTRQSSPTGTSSSGGPSTLRPNLNVNLSYHPRSHLSSPGILAHPEDAFNAYARFASDYSSCLPGAQYNGASVDEASALTWQEVQALQQVQQQQGQGQQQQQMQQAQMQQQMNGCLPPALLFAPSSSCTPASTPGGSRVPSPVPQQQQHPTSPPPSASPLNKVHTAPSASGSSTTSPQRGSSSQHHSASNSASASSSSHLNPSAAANMLRPASSLLLSKPFRCPKPNCNKSYKQANGLKYHMTHGSCNFAPPKDLEHVKDLLERKRRERDAQTIANGGTPLNRSLSLGSAAGQSQGQQAQNGGGQHQQSQIGGLPTTLDTALLSSYYDLNLQSMNITETELREVEREAEKRLRPFACGVGDCQRRYKNMNGLRYHYQHSGEHGAVGLALLASGQHECLQNNHGGKRREQHHGHHHSNSASSTSNQNATSNNYTSNNSTNTNNGTTASNNAYQTATFAMDEEREGRKRFATTAFNKQPSGSASVPVSRAGSTSRTGTPPVLPISVPVSANTSPKGSSTNILVGGPGNNNTATTSPPLSSMNAMSTTAMGGSSSLSGALGTTTGASNAAGAGTSAMTTPIQVVPVHGIQQVNGVGINTGLPPAPSSSSSSSSQSPPHHSSPQLSAASQVQAAPGSPAANAAAGQQQVTQQQMQQMAAAAYQQYAQQFQRQYQAAMQMHVAQSGANASQAGSLQQGSTSPGQRYAAQQQQQQQQYGQQQQQQQDWMAGVGMAMDMS